jgi:cellulose synthase/poly-beta-1,6-N-acetylglucosamine synthase-like glycosyltransferase
MQAQQPLPVITVLVPCRNERAFIARCLDSIVHNGYPSDRLFVLVVDGMSSDGTRAVLDAYAREYTYVRMIDNQGRTTPKALNLGLREARGAIVFRVDAHACLAPGYLRRCVDALQEYGADVVCGVMHTVPSTAGSGGKSHRRRARPSVRGREFVLPHSCLAPDLGGYGVLRLLPTRGV